MEKLASLISSLPLDEISDALSDVTLWWSRLVENVSPDLLPLYAYVGFSVVVLILWLFIARVLPKPFGAMSWIATFAVLFTPNTTISGETGVMSGDIAPASIVAVYGMLMGDTGLVIRSIVPILGVFTAGLILGFIWQLIRSIMQTNQSKEERQALLEEQYHLEEATENYLDIIDSEHEAPTS